jgi:hypothetical protein
MSLIEILALISRIQTNRKPFWQEPWKKHRRRAWKRQRSSGCAR